MSPVPNGSSAIRRLELSDAIKIRNGIIFDFYTGLPHMYVYLSQCSFHKQHLFLATIQFCDHRIIDTKECICMSHYEFIQSKPPTIYCCL